LTGLENRLKFEVATLTVVRAGLGAVVELPIDDYPLLLAFPIFTAPTFLVPATNEGEISLSGMATIRFGPSPEQVVARLGANEIRIVQDGYKSSNSRK
jgi:hypothetical protein